MWANVQRDGHPAEYSWRHLFNAANFGWRPLLECRAVMLPRWETHWNQLGCPKLPNGSQTLAGRAGRSSPYCKDMWKRYRCLSSFFPIVDMCLSYKDIARQMCMMVPRWRFFGDFLRLVFSASHVLHISDLHCKFALRPHHVLCVEVWQTSNLWWLRLDQERIKEEEEQTTGQKYKKYSVCICYAGRP